MSKTYQDYIAAIRQYEASGQYSYLNARYGYAGAYQISEDNLQRIGYYRKDSTPAKNDWIGSWTGKNGISSVAEFLQKPAAQDKAFLELQQWVWDSGFIHFNAKPYVGKTINGVTMTESGLLAGAHLVGAPELLKYLQSQGTTTPTDPYGTKVSKYVEMFNGYDVTPVTGTQTPPSPTPSSPAPSTPVTNMPPTAEDVIKVKVSGDHYQGRPNFSIAVDGKTIDSTNVVTAVHSNGQWQTFTFKGDFGKASDPHKVSITFTNDAYGGSKAADRNLHVDEVSFNGEVDGTNGKFTKNGTKHWDFGAGASPAEDVITVRVSGDQYKGAPNFALLVDGKTIDATNLVSASRSEGKWQTFTFKGDFDDAGVDLRKVGIKYTNNLYEGAGKDRNIYVDKVTFNGVVNDTDALLNKNATKVWDFDI